MKVKGVDTLLEALEPVLKKWKLYVVYAGEYIPTGQYQDEPRLIDRMKDRITSEGWEDHVHFLGRRNDVPRLMTSSDVLVHPPLEEGFGLVLVEALAAGLPIVATDVGGIPEVLEGTESIIFPPEDPTRLRQTVIDILNLSPDKRNRIVERGRKRAGDFSWEKRTKEMVKMFKNVCSNRF